MIPIPEVLAAVGGAACTAAGVVPWLARWRRSALGAQATQTGLRGEAEMLRRAAQMVAEESEHLIAARVPALITHLGHNHVPVPGLLHAELAGSPVDRHHRVVLELLTKAVLDERQRVDEAAQAVVRGAVRVIQAKSYQLQDRANDMQHRFEQDPELVQELMALDQLNEQILRRIQALGVVCGATTGLTRSDSHLGDIVVGAQSRVFGYERIKIASQLSAPVGVVARAAEPVAIVTAELLANAVHHSHGTLDVDVSLHQSATGATIVIDDAGVGMTTDEIDYARRMLSGRQPVFLTELGDPPRSGFAVIGRLIRQSGFTVAVDKPAPYGGVRAVIHLPGHLLTLMDETRVPMSAMAPLPHSVPRELPTAPETGTAQEELPRRRRRPPRPVAKGAESPDEGAAVSSERSPQEYAGIWGAFQRGSASGRTAAESSVPEREEGSGT